MHVRSPKTHTIGTNTEVDILDNMKYNNLHDSIYPKLTDESSPARDKKIFFPTYRTE